MLPKLVVREDSLKEVQKPPLGLEKIVSPLERRHDFLHVQRCLGQVCVAFEDGAYDGCFVFRLELIIDYLLRCSRSGEIAKVLGGFTLLWQVKLGVSSDYRASEEVIDRDTHLL